MPDRQGALARLLRLASSRPRSGGLRRPHRLATGWSALLDLERALCDDVCSPSAHDPSSRGTLSRAVGAALAGRRTAAFLTPGDVDGVREALGNAAQRRTPLLVHATLDARTLAEVVDVGALVVTARNARRAIDAALWLRAVAETALCPAVLLVDAAETADALQDVHTPDAAVVAAVGRPDDTIETPSAEQRFLLGDRRRRMPRWFDPDRPGLLGASGDGRIAESAGLARQRLVRAELGRIAARLAESAPFESAPGVERLRSRKAALVVVACGAAVEAAEAAAHALDRRRIAVVDAGRVDPLPVDALRRAVGDAGRVVVLERTAADGPTPLTERVRAALDDGEVRAIGFDVLDVEAVAAAFAEALGDGRGRLHVRTARVDPHPGFPRYDSIRDRLRREFPDLDADGPPRPVPVDDPPANQSTLTLLGDAGSDVAAVLDRVADDLGGLLGQYARGRTAPFGDDGRRADLLFSRAPVERVAFAARPAAVVVDRAATLRRAPTAPRPRAGGAVVIGDAGEAQAVWSGLPPAWRAAARGGEFRVVPVRGGLDEAAAAAARVLTGAADAPPALTPAELTDPPASSEPAELPLVVRRFGDTGTGWDHVARFWGEFERPLDGGERGIPVDPYTALAAVPPCTSTFRDRAHERDRMPSIDPARCTGCGACWATCPDSAIAPVALAIEAWLGAAADDAGFADDDAHAAALRRVHRQLAARIETELARDGARVLDDAVLGRAFEWLLTRLGPEDDARAGLEEAFARTSAVLTTWPLSAPDAFLHEAHREEKGSGALLMLAINPQSCQACGLCAAVCPDEAISVGEQTAERLDRARREWRTWEALPDTPGPIVARAMRHPRVGALEGLLLSRHGLFAMAGGDSAEPGSGERIAIRQTTAVVEYVAQRRTLDAAAFVAELVASLRARIGEMLGAATAVDDLRAFGAALAADDDDADGTIAGVIGRVAEGAGPRRIDVERLRRLADLAVALEDEHRRVLEGAYGSGRARFGVVIASGALASEFARFPRNAFSVPVAVATGPDAAPTVAGLATASRAGAVAEARLLRRARLELDPPADAEAARAELDGLDWEDLTDDERARALPVLVLTTEAEARHTAAVLEAGAPIVVLLLDGLSGPPERDPTLAAIARRDLWVAAISIAHREHLFESVERALRSGAPALLHAAAPSPRRHGLATDRTIARADELVRDRTHPLVRYDPRASGVFGTRLDLTGNPDLPSGDEAPRTSSVPGPNGQGLVAGGDSSGRFATLLEMAGIVTPFAKSAPAAAAPDEDGDARAAEARLTALRRAQADDAAARLRERLLAIAGYPGPRP